MNHTIIDLAKIKLYVMLLRVPASTLTDNEAVLLSSLAKEPAIQAQLEEALKSAPVIDPER